MGGTSVGIPNDHHVMLTNPGNLGTINTTAFSSLILVDYLRISDHDVYTDHINAVPRQISFALPFSIAGTVAFSLAKNSDATIKYRQENCMIPSGDPLFPKYYRISFDSEGGMTSWQAGWGRNIGKFVNVGIAYQRSYFLLNSAKLEEFTYSQIIQDSTDTSESIISRITVRDSSHLVLRGNTIRLGFLGTIKGFSVGLAFNYHLKEDLSYNNALYNGISIEPIDRTNAKIVIQPPPSVAMGLSYAPSPKWLLGADVSLDLWNYYSLELDNVPAETRKKIREDIADISTDNTISVSSGFRFIPAPDLLAPKYWETIHYMAGIRYTQLPGKNSSEISGSFGLGLPLSGNGLFNIGCELGKRTHESYPDYRETFVQVIFSLNGGRKWRKIPTGTY
jgi:hypothetical protein